MSDAPSERVYGDPLARWFVTEAFRIGDTGELIAAAGRKLAEAGIPLARLAYFQSTLHPAVAGKGYFWRPDRGLQVGEAGHGLWEGPAYRDNPLPQVIEQRRIVRVRLGEVEPRAPVLAELKDEGATDYVAVPLLFTTGHVHALSIVSDVPGGFSDHDLQRLYQLQFAFTRILESHSLRDTAVNLLDAYVGRAAGQRILAGDVRRGEGQSIEAVIWYCDLRGFTRLSDSLPHDVVIALLNDFFGAMGEAVTEAGGEILKFMGDAMLAMFPIARPEERSTTVDRATRAAVAAEDAVGTLNLARSAAGTPLIRFGLALHVGDVMFGNIGASQRLDFTVIGPAVNHAARLETLAATLDRPIVVSAAVAAHLPERLLEPLGQHMLKDVVQPQPVFGLARTGGFNAGAAAAPR